MDHRKELKKKLSECYERLMKQWMASSPAKLVADAEEIAAATFIHNSLVDAITEGDAEVLLRLDDPLAVMRSKWIEENGSGMACDDELIHCVMSLTQEEPKEGAPLTIQQALCLRVQENFDGFRQEWGKLRPAELVEKAAEITAIREAYAALEQAGLDGRVCERLLQLQNPLDVIGERILAENRLGTLGDGTRVQQALQLIYHANGGCPPDPDESARNTDVRTMLRQRLAENYQDFQKMWRGDSPVGLMEKAAEIAAIQEAYHTLDSALLGQSVCRLLLRYQNPLESVGGITHTFMDEAFISPDGETRFQRAVRELTDHQEATLCQEQPENAAPRIEEVSM